MKTLNKIIALLLVCALPSFATNPAYVGGNAAQCTSATTCTVSYTVNTPGDTIVGCIGVNGTTTSFTSFKDNAGTPNSLTAGSQLTPTPAGAIYYYTAPSGITAFTSTISNAHAASIAVVEYSNVASVNGSPSNPTGSGTGVTLTVSPTASESGDMAVGCLTVVSATNPQTASAGTVRQTESTTAPSTVAIEHQATGATGTALTTTVGTGAAWSAVAIILKTATGTVVNPPRPRIM